MKEQEKTFEELNNQISWFLRLSHGDEDSRVSSWRDVYKELIEKMEEQDKNIQELQARVEFSREITHHKELHESGLMSPTSLKKADSEQSIESEHSVVLSGVLLSGHHDLKKHVQEQDKTMWELKIQVEFLREITQHKDQEDESPSSPESLKGK